MLATIAPGAFASTTDELRGEWKFELECQCELPYADSNTLTGTALISTMNQATGEFSGSTEFDGYPGEFVENLTSKEKPHVTGNKVVYVLVNATPGGDFFFVVNEGTVAGGGDEMSGAGIFNADTPYEEQGSFTAKKIRSWAEIEKELKEKKEREEKEKLEREGREKGEKEGREKGEKEGREKGEQEAHSKAEQEGRSKGEQEGREKAEQEVKLKAEQEATQRAAAEAQAKSEREAKEKTEKEATEKAETQGREKAEREAREKIEREAAERSAKEAKQKAEKEAKERLRSNTGQPAVLAGKSFTVATSGQLSLELTNANGYTVSGALTLSPAATTKSASGAGGTAGGAPGNGKGTTGKAKSIVLAEAAYTIASHGNKTVELKLAKSALAELEHHKTLQLVATVTTRASGKPSSTKSYDITLKLAPPKASPKG